MSTTATKASDVPTLNFVEPQTAFSTFNVLCPDDLARFWLKVEKGKDDTCWRWLGGFFSTGYPAFWVRRSNIGGHRIMCAMHHGLAAGRMALHSCDNPGCVNPQHLRWGTPADNMQDRSARARAPRGETHPNSRLKVGEVRDIRARAATGESLSAIARSHGVTAQAVHRIVNRDVWKHVP